MNRNATGTRWAVVLPVVAVGIVTALMVGKMPPSLPSLRDELGLDLVTAGWVASAFNLCAALLGVAAGVAADRAGPIRAMTLGLVLVAAGGGLGALSVGPVTLIASRLIEGLGFVAAVVAAPGVLIASAAVRDRNLVLGLWSTYLPAGAAIALLATPLLLETVGWRGVWTIGAVLAGIGALAVRLLNARVPGTIGEPRRFDDVRAALALPGPWLYAACFLVYSVQFFAVMTWIPTFLIESQGYGLAAAATAGALVVLANVGGTLAGTALMHRGAPRWSLLIGAYLPMMGCAWAIFDPGAPDSMRVPAAVVLSLVGGLLPAASLAGAPQHARRPQEAATCSGVVVQGANTGSLLGAPIMAVTVDALHGWGHAWWMLAAFGCVGVTLALVLRTVEQRRFA
ncbi:putative MFS transporter [alpha proteobacterium BAL199]|nr:putative MFS transporter [alpha proteobacterium BAL199]